MEVLSLKDGKPLTTSVVRGGITVAENITSIEIDDNRVLLSIPGEPGAACSFASEQQARKCFEEIKHFLRSDLADLFVIAEQPGFTSFGQWYLD
jgi:hypothetical protein